MDESVPNRVTEEREMNNLNPTISIIVPVYNTALYLPKCLDSIAAQTFTDFEVLMIDDGSTDGSGEICDRYSQSDSRFIAIHQFNQGVSASRNNGLKQARGSYISFIDSDDYVHLQMLELLYNGIRQEDYDLAIAYYKTVVINEKINFQPIVTPCFIDIPIQETIARLFISGEDMRYGSCWNKLYDKRLLEGICFSDFKISEDFFFNMEVLSKASKVVGVEHVLYYYLQHETSTVHQLSKRKEVDRIDVIYKCLDFCLSGSDTEAHCLLKLYKTLFSTRLRVRNEIYEKDVVITITKVHKQICKRFFHNKHIPCHTKLLFMILYYVPFIYQVFRTLCELRARI